MIRALALTDALPYVSFRKRAPVNDAVAGPSGATNRLGIAHLLGHSALPYQTRLSWISTDRGQITGLVSVTSRFAADIWDVDQLAAVPGVDQPKIYAELLSHLVSSACAEAVQRIFLRVQTNSAAEAASQQVGFCAYTTETIYTIDSNSSPATTRTIAFRPRRPVDHQALFQLYCASVPARVRQIEGLTLREWRATDGWRLYPVNWRVGLPRHRRDFVAEEAGPLVAWLQIEPRSAVIRLMIRPSWQVDIGDVIGQSTHYARKQRHVLIPVRDYQEPIRAFLEAQGYAPIARHSLLSRSLAVRILEPKLVHGWRECVPVREAGM